jgi:nucleoside-diphosphate-sugar epimerase
VSRLLDEGHPVAALVRSSSGAASLAGLGCGVVRGGLEDDRALDALVAGADVVFHVAGVVAARSEREFLVTNRDGAAATAGACVRAGVGRLVLVSSLAVTGPSDGARPTTEASGTGPVTSYGRSKRAGEDAVRASGVPFTILRPAAVYGPRDRAFLPLFHAAAHGLVPLLGSGDQPLTLVHASDLARALLAAATAPCALGRTYHAGSPDPVTQRALAEATGRAVGRRVRCLTLSAPLVRATLRAFGAVSRATGRAPLLDADKANELLAPGWVCSSERLRDETGWSALVPLDDGLRETAGAYRAAGWL